MTPPAKCPSRLTLDRVPARSLTFIMAVAACGPIQTALASRGYSQAEHDYAFGRLSLLGELPKLPEPAADDKVRPAVVELDAWDDPHFAAIRATLERQYPEIAERLFENLEPKQGPEAVMGVDLLLRRLTDMENGKGKDKAAHKQDLAALELLASRGYTQAERERLRGLVKTAKTLTVPAVALDDAGRAKILLDLYRWLNDWSAQARIVITKRAHLIRLGLAKPRKASKEVEPEADTDTTPDAVPNVTG